MSLAFLLPAALAGLAALLLPLLLHLARRREARRLSFAAMRWLPAGRSARRRVRIEERMLLLLRLLLLAAAALWLAQPVLRGAIGGPRSWVAAWPGSDASAARAAASTADRAVWLAAGFPSLDAEPPSAGAGASLLRELDARLPPEDALTVLVPDLVDGLDAAPLALRRAVSFRVVPAAPADPAAAGAPATRVLLLTGAGASPALPYLRAALAAWRGDRGERLDVAERAEAEAAPDSVDAVVRVDVDQPVPAAVADLPRVDVVATGADAPGAGLHVLAWPDDGSVPALALDPGFPGWLAERLRPEPRPGRATADAVTASAVVGLPDPGGRSLALERPLADWLALAMAVLFLIERLLATGTRLRRQA